MGIYQEYTSSAGGKIFFCPSCSFLKNLFKSKNSLLSNSSFNTANQLSSSVSISRPKSSLCSVVSFSAHFFLSNFGFGNSASSRAVATVVSIVFPVLVSVVVLVVVEMVLDTILGGPKKDVMLPLALTFFASVAAASAAFLLRDMAIGRLRKRMKRDTLKSLYPGNCALFVVVCFRTLQLSITSRCAPNWNWYGERDFWCVDSRYHATLIRHQPLKQSL